MPELPNDSPPVIMLAPSLHNLPTQPTALLGREEQVAALCAVLRREDVRLLTLTGPGGIGKTRLAVQMAAELVEEHADGVWLVHLSRLVDPTLVVPTIAQTLGLQEQGSQSLAELLQAHLADRRLLLVLDNFEQVVGAASEVATLLAVSPGLKVLVTSRLPLHLRGERVHAVPPLPLAAPAHVSPERLTQYPAVALFAERAQAALDTFKVTADNAPVIAEICAQLGGLPLAIELAAARVRVLPPEALLARLSAQLKLLTGGARDLEERQRTMRATIAWSEDLLAPEERVLFRRLAVFVGGATMEAAEAVCVTPGPHGLGVEPLDLDLLEGLSTLVEQSLLQQRAERAEGEEGGEPRFSMLEVIREYGLERLEASKEAEALRRTHAAFFLELAERAEPELTGPEQRAWLDGLEREHDNLRAAIAWSLHHGNPEQAGALVASLWMFWLVRGHLAEGKRWLEFALARLPAATLARARVLQSLTVLTIHLQGYAATASLVEEALAICRKLGDSRSLAAALLNAGIVAHSHGDYAGAVSFFEESLPISAKLGWAHGTSLCLSSMGFAVLHLGDIPRARALCAEGVVQARAASDLRTVAAASANLGITLLLDHQYELATERLEESLRLRRELGDTGGIAHTLCYLGRAEIEQGNPAQAETRYLESFALRDELGEDAGLAAALEGLGVVAAARGEVVTAVVRFGAANTLRERAGMPVPSIDRPFDERWLARTRDLLDGGAWDAAWAAGGALTPREARDARSALSPASGLDSDAGRSRVEAARNGDDEHRASATNGLPGSWLRVFALGDARVYRGADLVSAAEWTYSRARELLFYLLCHESATKNQIGLALWPDADATQLRAQLHPVLHHLRRALGGPDWVVFEHGRYRFNRALDYTFDVEEFEEHLEEAKRCQRDDPAHAVRLLEQALKLYRGDFLGGLAESEWAAGRREELRRRRREMLLALGQLHSAVGAHARAAQTYRQLILDDPYQERAHRELMRALARMGERAQALHTFEGLSELLERELGALPSPETAALAERVRRGDRV
jgi:predicted ATPase/DNA-binding SARP family transcriptional activator